MTDTRRIITVDIGRSTWQGYASEAPKLPVKGSDQDIIRRWLEALDGTSSAAPSSFNIINLGEGI